MSDKMPNPDFQYGSQGYYSADTAITYARNTSGFGCIYNTDLGDPAVKVDRQSWYSWTQVDTLLGRAKSMAQSAKGLPEFTTNGEDIMQRMRILRFGAYCVEEYKASLKPEGVVIDLNEVSMKAIHDAYVQRFGPLPEAMMMNDIIYHVIDMITADGLGNDPHMFPLPAPVVTEKKGTAIRELWDRNQMVGFAYDHYIGYLRRLAFPFQERVRHWLTKCFGTGIAYDLKERNYRFGEEALELIQACGATKEEAHQLVDYVFGRPVGEMKQEMGGVMVTLAALALANNINMVECGEAELARVNTEEMIEKIRRKNASKPKFGPLPGKE